MKQNARRLAICMLWALALAAAACNPKTPFSFSSDIYHYQPPGTLTAVPAGSFTMGSGQTAPFRDEQPQHLVYVSAFSIETHEVTNAQYRACVGAGACVDPPSGWPGSDEQYYTEGKFNDFPVLNVPWDSAINYCRWRGRRLPTEAEWEKAARGAADDRDYPWGWAEPTCDLADLSVPVADSLDPDAQYHETCLLFPVGVEAYAGSASPYGALNMTGNAAEWVADYYADNYYVASVWPGNAHDPQGPSSGDERVVRGGSYDDTAIYARVAYRGRRLPDQPDATIGFRCAQSGSGP